MAKYNWVSSTKFIGVRYHQHPTRKNGVQFDRLYAIRYQMEGKRFEHTLGWASEGWTEQKAGLELAKIKEGYKLGQGAISLSEKRKIAQEKRAEEERLKAEEDKKLITFAEFWESRYWKSQQQKAKSSLVSEDGLYRKWVKPIIGDKPLIHVKAVDLEKIKQNMLSANKSPSTMKYVFAVISQVWTVARFDELTLGDSPTKKVKLPTQDNRRERFLTLEESKLLLEELKKHSIQIHDMSLMAIYTGMRFGEIASLEWQNVDLVSAKVFIKDPKSKKNRHTELKGKLLQMLIDRKEEIVQSGNKAIGLIFPDKNGNVMASVSHTYTRVADRLFNEGVKDRRDKVCFHTLRHTFASWLVQNGTDLYVVKELMGHSDFKMTLRYSHLAPDNFSKAISLLPE